MRRKLKRILAIALAVIISCLALAILLIPRLLEVEKVRGEIISQISTRLDGKVRISEIRWSWLPIPHLTAVNASFENDQIALTVPALRLYPDWKSFWGEEVGLSKVVITSPHIVARSVSALVVPGQAVFPEKLRVLIEKGSLELEEQNTWPFTKEIRLQTFSATVDLASDSVQFNLISVPSFAAGLAVKGAYQISDQSYDVHLYCEKLKLAEAIAALEKDGSVVPLPSEANLKASIEGKGLREIKAEISGALPCFLIKPSDRQFPFTCGFADLAFVKKGEEFSLDIRNLEIREPGITLSGRIERYLPPDQTEPRWLLDLKGEEVNLSEIREAVLTLWGEHPVTQTVASIVLGGLAGKGGYKFDGRLSDFEDIRSMTITAEDIKADIHVPGAEIDLSETDAFMVIKDGNLMLRNGSARFRNSRGRNCSLLLGLTDDSDLFKLDLDIEADLADLPDTLLHLVQEEKFQEEVKKFSKVSGSANAHLHLGDRLSDFIVEVGVKDINLHAGYEHLNWDFQINQGALQVKPQSVSWQGVDGILGPHRVWNGSGSVHWEEGVQIEIDSLDAFIFGPALGVEDFRFYPELKTMLTRDIDFLEGFLKLSNTTLSGPVGSPANWKYKTTIDLDGVRWESPLLPAPVNTGKGTLKVSESSVEIDNFSSRIFEDSIVLQSTLTHAGFSDWHGSVTISGSIHKDLAQWLRKKDWIPPVFFPTIPCNLKNLTYRWEEGGFSLAGTIIPGEDGRERPRLELSYCSSRDNPQMMKLDILGATERGVLTVDFLDNLPETIALSWQGVITGETVAAIFADKNLLQGRIQGDINLNINPETARAYMEGELQVEKLRWYWVGTAFRYLEVDELRLTGKGKEATIEKLTLGFPNNESVSLGGNLFLSKEGLKVDLDLTSPSLSILTAAGFLSDLSVQKDLVLTDDDKATTSLQSWAITGHVDFNIKEFISGDRATPENQLPTSTLVWTPLVGSFVLHPQGRMVAEITSGRLCCLSATGKWYSDPAMGDSSFTITSDCPETPLFENILPCLGFDQDLIVGKLALNANLKGQIKNWKSGSLTITSNQGRILRLRALSNIFKVVNLTDLFTSFDYGGTDERGFAYNELILETAVDNNKLNIEKAVVRGEGLNLFARGDLDLGTLDADIVVMIAPLKTLDAIVAKVPLVGRVIGGENAAVITIPVGIKGNIRDPEVTVLPPSAVGEGILSIVKNALMLPFQILSPILPEEFEKELQQ